MSNLIFALEDDALDQLNEPQPYDCNIDAMVGGIEVAMESLETLKKLKAVFQKQKNKKPSKSSIKIGMLAMERIKDSVGIFKDELIVAQECFTEDSVSLEGITGIMQSIWDAIVRTFKAIWDLISSLFVTSTHNQSNKEAKQARDTVKAAVRSNKAPDQEVLLPQMVSQNFRYISEDPQVKDLQGEAELLRNTVKIVEGVVQNLEVCNVNVADFIQKLRHREIGPGDYSGIHQAMGFFQSYLIDNFSTSNEADLLKYIKDNFPEQADKVDQKTLRTLNGLSRGKRVIAFMYDIKGDDTNIYVNIIHPDKLDGAAKIRVPDSSDSLSYCELVVDLTTKTLDMMDVFKVKTGKITSTQKAMLSNLNDMFKMYSQDPDSEDMAILLNFAQSVTKSMTGFLKDMVRVVRVVEVSALDHSRVSSAISKAYKA